MFSRRGFIAGTGALLTAGCASQSGIQRISTRSYAGPKITQIIVSKHRRHMWLMHKDQIVKEYRIGLGYAPKGDKKIKGDGKTPEGRYYIDRRNPNSRYHLSLGISYPNANDVAEAKALGKDPGGDIFIHGQASDPRIRRTRGRDWTIGCIAVKNREIEDIYLMVDNGTVIDILP